MLSGLYFLFKSLVKADASDIFPVVGSISAFFVLLLSFLFFNQILHTEFFFGFSSGACLTMLCIIHI
jgi:uncharacterized membrane protein